MNKKMFAIMLCVVPMMKADASFFDSLKKAASKAMDTVRSKTFNISTIEKSAKSNPRALGEILYAALNIKDKNDSALGQGFTLYYTDTSSSNKVGYVTPDGLNAGAESSRKIILSKDLSSITIMTSDKTGTYALNSKIKDALVNFVAHPMTPININTIENDFDNEIAKTQRYTWKKGDKILWPHSSGSSAHSSVLSDTRDLNNEMPMAN